MMSNCRVLCIFVIVTALLSITTVQGGPIRSFASVMAARPVKIPRAIRAPFRNSEMMTARGFGKRSQQAIKFKDDNLLKTDTEIPWSVNKIDTQDGLNSADNEAAQKVLNGEFDESYPIDMIVQEMTGNAAFLRSVLERVVDSNHDGQITLRELFNGVSPATTNDLI